MKSILGFVETGSFLGIVLPTTRGRVGADEEDEEPEGLSDMAS